MGPSSASMSLLELEAALNASLRPEPSEDFFGTWLIGTELIDLEIQRQMRPLPSRRPLQKRSAVAGPTTPKENLSGQK